MAGNIQAQLGLEHMDAPFWNSLPVSPVGFLFSSKKALSKPHSSVSCMIFPAHCSVFQIPATWSDFQPTLNGVPVLAGVGMRLGL